MQILREEYRQTREVIASCQRDCGYFLQRLHRTAPGLQAYCPPDTRAMRTNTLLRERRQSLSSKCGQTWDSHHLVSRLRCHTSRVTRRVHLPHELLSDAVPFSVDSEAGRPDDEDDNIVEKNASIGRVDNPANIPHSVDDAREVIADKCAVEKSRSASGFDSINEKTGVLTTHAAVPRVRYSAHVRPSSSSSFKLLQGQVTSERPPWVGQTGCRYGKDAYTECEHLLRNRIIGQFEIIFGPRTYSPETDLDDASPSEVTQLIQDVVVAPSSSKPLRPQTAGLTRVCNAAPRPHTAGIMSSCTKPLPRHKAAVPHSSTKRVQSAYPTLRQRVKTVNITRPSSVTKLVLPEYQDRTGASPIPETVPPTFQNSIDAPTASHISPEETSTPHVPPDMPLTSPSTSDALSPPHTHPQVQASIDPTSISTNTLPQSRLSAVGIESQAHIQQAHIPFTPMAQAQPPHGQCASPAHVTNPNQKHSTVLADSTCKIAPRTFAPLTTLSHMTTTRQLVSRLLSLGVKENSRDRPKSAPTKYELSHRSLPAPRQTVIGILAQIENRRAEIRAKLKMSKELQDVVKSLVPCD